jgi:hypothetical protein
LTRGKKLTEHDIGKDLVIQHLPAKESNGRTALRKFVGKVLVGVKNRSRELSAGVVVGTEIRRLRQRWLTLGETRAKKARNFLDENF